MKPQAAHRAEKGQALAETAVFSSMAVLLALGILALIPIHRTRTVATTAAFACAQFVSQSRDPNQAVIQARLVARRTVSADWSGTLGAAYAVEAWATGSGVGGAGCRVHYRAPVLFNGLLGLVPPRWHTVEFTARAEPWKADWP